MQEMQKMWVWSLGQEDPLEKEMAIHSSILAWEIQWTEEPWGLQSMESQRVRHNTATKQQQHGNTGRYIDFMACVSAKSLQSCLTLCNPVDNSPPGSTVYGFLQARILEWVTMPSSGESSLSRDQTHVSGIAGGFFTTSTIWEAHRLYGPKLFTIYHMQLQILH